MVIGLPRGLCMVQTCLLRPQGPLQCCTQTHDASCPRYASWTWARQCSGPQSLTSLESRWIWTGQHWCKVSGLCRRNIKHQSVARPWCAYEGPAQSQLIIPSKFGLLEFSKDHFYGCKDHFYACKVPNINCFVCCYLQCVSALQPRQYWQTRLRFCFIRALYTWDVCIQCLSKYVCCSQAEGRRSVVPKSMMHLVLKCIMDFGATLQRPLRPWLHQRASGPW